MNRLQPQFYLSFPVVQADYKTVLIDLGSYARLFKNARFVKYLIKKSSLNTVQRETSQLIQAKAEFLKQDEKSKNKNSCSLLELLHLNVSLESRVFIPISEVKENKFYLMTEKFFWVHPTANLGSGRHALLLDMQIKGVGRNPLAIRHDYCHSWGGNYLWQAMKGYVIGQLLEGATPLGILKTPYVAVKVEKTETPQMKSSAISLAIREAEALRVTQIMTSFEGGMKISRKNILQDLLKKNKVKSISLHMEQIFFHYAALFLMGLRHMSVTRENVTLEGKLIDYEDIRLDTDAEHFKFFLLTHKCKRKVSKGFIKYKGSRIFTSSLHFYLSAIKLTSIGLTQLDPLFKINETLIKKKFEKILKLLAREVFIVDKELMSFIEHLLNCNAIYQNSQLGLEKRSTSATSSLKKLQKRDLIVDNVQDLGSEEATYYLVKFPRVKFRNSFVERYTSHALKTPEEVVERCFKMLQIESYAGVIDYPKMLSFSSDCNQLISKHALVFPYQLRGKKILIKKTSKYYFEEKYRKKIKKDLKASVVEFDKVDDLNSNDKIIRGAKIRLSDGTVHYASIAPTYVT